MTAVLQDPALEVDRVVTVGGGPRLANQGVQEVRAFVSAIGEYDSVDEFVRGVVEYDSYKSEVHTRQTAGFNVMQRVDGKFVSKHDRRRYEGRSHTQSNDSALTLEECQLIRCPVLVIRGEDSRVLTDELATQLSRHFPNGQLKTVPSAGHNVHSQNTSGFLAALEPFLG